MARIPELFPTKNIKWTLAIKEIFTEKRKIHVRAIRYNFTVETLKISVISMDAKANWYSAGYLTQVAEGLTIESRQVALNRDCLLLLPEVETIYKLNFKIHPWIKNATLTIYQGILDFQ